MRNCPPFSFRLRPTSRFNQALIPGWEPGTSKGFLPFSAITQPTRRTSFHSYALPVHRFSQPSDRSNADIGPQVYSTLQALLGSCLQSLTPKRSTAVSSYVLLRRYLLFMVSFRTTVRFPAFTTTADYPAATTHCSAPRFLTKTGFHLEL